MADPTAGIQYREDELPSIDEAVNALRPLEQQARALFKVGTVLRAAQQIQQGARALTAQVEALRAEQAALQSQLGETRTQAAAARDAVDTAMRHHDQAEEAASRARAEVESAQSELAQIERSKLAAVNARDAAERDRVAIVKAIESSRAELEKLTRDSAQKIQGMQRAETEARASLEAAQAEIAAHVQRLSGARAS